MPRLVRNPFFVDVVVGARQDAHDLAAARVDADGAAKRIHDVDQFRFVELPRPRRERIRLRRQRADRADIDHVGLQFRGHRLFEIGRDLHVLAAADGAELRYTRDLGRKTHTASALDATVHRSLDQRAEIFVLDGALVLMEAAGIDAVSHRLILQIALAALVADRAIQRMIDQKEFHHAFARLAHHRRAREQGFWRAVLVRHQILDAHGAGRLRLRYAGNLDEAHAAIAGNRQPLVEAEARNFRTTGLAGLEQRVLWRDVDLSAVDGELGHAACPPDAQRAVFHNCAAGTPAQSNANSDGPCAARCSSRSFASIRPGR